MTNIVFVVGEAATGKSTLAQKLSDELVLPLLSKDKLKVILFDALGWKDREWSKAIGKACYELLDHLIEEELKSGNSLIIESTFNPSISNPQFQALQNKYKFNAVQIYCHADDAVIIQRFKARAMVDERHVSHIEGEEGLSDLMKRLKDKQASTLDLQGRVINVDTTDFGDVDYAQIITEVAKYVH
jgi:predicted kinase